MLTSFCKRNRKWLLLWVVNATINNIPTEHPSSPPLCSGVRVTRSLVLYVCFVDRCLFFYAFSFGHCVQLSVLLWYTDCDCSFGIFKLFCLNRTRKRNLVQCRKYLLISPDYRSPINSEHTTGLNRVLLRNFALHIVVDSLIGWWGGS